MKIVLFLIFEIKAFWADNSGDTDCVNDASGVQGAEYGYTSSPNVTVTIVTPKETTFSATAVHTSDSASPKVLFTMDANGVITKP